MHWPRRVSVCAHVCTFVCALCTYVSALCLHLCNLFFSSALSRRTIEFFPSAAASGKDVDPVSGPGQCADPGAARCPGPILKMPLFG